MKWRLIAVAVLAAVVAAASLTWILHASPVNHWLAVHTGTVNEPGPYYGFWSGFGSDLAEFGILGAIGTGVYQLVKKYNCHEPGAGASARIRPQVVSSYCATATTRTFKESGPIMN